MTLCYFNTLAYDVQFDSQADGFDVSIRNYAIPLSDANATPFDFVPKLISFFHQF